MATLSLPADVVTSVRARVESGEFADEGEVIVEALAALQAREQTCEQWLRTEVVAAWEEHQADPGAARSLVQTRAGLRARYDRVVTAGKA